MPGYSEGVIVEGAGPSVIDSNLFTDPRSDRFSFFDPAPNYFDFGRYGDQSKSETGSFLTRLWDCLSSWECIKENVKFSWSPTGWEIAIAGLGYSRQKGGQVAPKTGATTEAIERQKFIVTSIVILLGIVLVLWLARRSR